MQSGQLLLDMDRECSQGRWQGGDEAARVHFCGSELAEGIATSVRVQRKNSDTDEFSGPACSEESVHSAGSKYGHFLECFAGFRGRLVIFSFWWCWLQIKKGCESIRIQLKR